MLSAVKLKISFPKYSAIQLPRKNPIIPPANPNINALKRIINPMVKELFPMAFKRPISFFLALTF